MLSPSANPAVLRARNHHSLACRTGRSLDVQTSLHHFPTESFIVPIADLSAPETHPHVHIKKLKFIIAPRCISAIASLRLLAYLHLFHTSLPSDSWTATGVRAIITRASIWSRK